MQNYNNLIERGIDAVPFLQKRKNAQYLKIPDLNRYRSRQDQKHVCHAPFKSIRFEQQGFVRTCCFNQQVVLGRYPQQSIREIWNSEEANRLRSKIKQNDLSYGCQLCAQQLRNGEFDAVKTRQFDNMDNDPEGFPIMLDFSIHNTCNLECIMCNGEFSSSIRKNREQLPPMEMAYDQQFAEQLEEFIPHARQMVFAGGEPFLIDLYHDLWERINDLNPSAEVHIVTNGTILNKKVQRILENGNYSITHSIESFRKENYQAIRQNSSYEKMMDHLSYFQEYCQKRGTEYAINICPLQQNWEEIPEFVHYCNENSIRLYILTVIYPPHATLMTLPSAKLREVISYYERFIFRPESDVEHHNVNQFKDLRTRLANWQRKAEQEESQQQDSSRLSVFGNRDDDAVDFSEVLSQIRQKLNEHMAQHPSAHGMNTQQIEDQLSFLNNAFADKPVYRSKLIDIENVSPSMMASIFKTYSNDDLYQTVKDHFL